MTGSDDEFADLEKAFLSTMRACAETEEEVAKDQQRVDGLQRQVDEIQKCVVIGHFVSLFESALVEAIGLR